MTELEREARQVEPLLVTAEGLVVNGNRRLAAMRALQLRDPVRYAGFAEVSHPTPRRVVMRIDLHPDHAEEGGPPSPCRSN
jgi:hypothetical protein